MSDDRELFGVLNGFENSRKRVMQAINQEVEETVNALVTPWPSKSWIEELCDGVQTDEKTLYEAVSARLRTALEVGFQEGNDEAEVVDEFRYSILCSNPLVLWELFSDAVHIGLENQVGQSLHWEQARTRWQSTFAWVTRSIPKAQPYRTREQSHIESLQKTLLKMAAGVLELRARNQRLQTDNDFAVRDLQRQVALMATAHMVEPSSSSSCLAGLPSTRPDIADSSTQTPPSLPAASYPALPAPPGPVAVHQDDSALRPPALPSSLIPAAEVESHSAELEALQLQLNQERRDASRQIADLNQRLKLIQEQALQTHRENSHELATLVYKDAVRLSQRQKDEEPVHLHPASGAVVPSVMLTGQDPACQLAMRDTLALTQTQNRELQSQLQEALLSQRQERGEQSRLRDDLNIKVQEANQKVRSLSLRLEEAEERERKMLKDHAKSQEHARQEIERTANCLPMETEAKVRKLERQVLEAQEAVQELERDLRSERALKESSTAQVRLLQERVRTAEAKQDELNSLPTLTLAPQAKDPNADLQKALELAQVGNLRLRSELQAQAKQHQVELERERTHAKAIHSSEVEARQAALGTAEMRAVQEQLNLQAQLKSYVMQVDDYKQRLASAEAARIVMEANNGALGNKLDEANEQNALLRAKLSQVASDRIASWRHPS